MIYSKKRPPSPGPKSKRKDGRSRPVFVHLLPAGVSNSTCNFGFEYACGGIYGGPTCFAGSHSRTSAGWTVGAGAEYEFARHVTLKFEYLYVNLGSDTFASPAVVFFNAPSFLKASFGDAAFNLVRMGVNYRF
jgi:outer membrane immunogenic protein